MSDNYETFQDEAETLRAIADRCPQVISIILGIWHARHVAWLVDIGVLDRDDVAQYVTYLEAMENAVGDVTDPRGEGDDIVTFPLEI